MTERRDFFKRLFSEIYVLKEEAVGNRHFKLSDLWKLDENKFRQLKFRVREGIAIQYNENDIRAIKEKGEIVFLCATETPKEKVFHLLQQRLSVGEIAEQLTAGENVEYRDQFHKIRDFVLFLVKQTVCLPANDIYYNPENDGEGDILDGRVQT